MEAETADSAAPSERGTTTSLSTSGTTRTSAAQSATRTQQQTVPGHVQTAADALGRSTSDVMSASKSGESLNDIADDQGVSHEELVAAFSVYGTSTTSAQQSTLSALSDLLDTDSSSLLTQLQSGTDLTDLLSAEGVTLDQLSSELEDGLLVDTRACWVVTRRRGGPGATRRA